MEKLYTLLREARADLEALRVQGGIGGELAEGRREGSREADRASELVPADLFGRLQWEP